MFESLVRGLAPLNKKLLHKREVLQTQIDAWHLKNKGQVHDEKAYKQMLFDIGYLVSEGEDFKITTSNVDPEIASISGPQLVVPTSNARFALNAVNARWGSLYDALYGTDAIDEGNGKERSGEYNAERGAAVIEYVAGFLDDAFKLKMGSHKDVIKYSISDDKLVINFSNDGTTSLANSAQFVGYQGPKNDPSAVLLRNNDLHVEIQFDRKDPIGGNSLSGLKDVVMEAAVTTIQDFEDSVAAVDADDKAKIYENFLGLMKGDLEETFEKNGETVTRRMNPDRE